MNTNTLSDLDLIEAFCEAQNEYIRLCDEHSEVDLAARDKNGWMTEESAKAPLEYFHLMQAQASVISTYRTELKRRGLIEVTF